MGSPPVGARSDRGSLRWTQRPRGADDRSNDVDRARFGRDPVTTSTSLTGAPRPRRRRTAALLLVVGVGVAVLLALTAGDCGGPFEADPGPAPAGDGATGTGTVGPSRARARSPKAQDRAPDRGPEPARPAADGPPLRVDGWPAADVVVLGADGNPLADAVVWVHPAGAPSPESVQRIPTSATDANGRARIVVPTAGRYDVGARQRRGDVIALVLRDVTFPARDPVEIRLQRIATLALVWSPGVTAERAALEFSLAGSERVGPFPGRSESTSVRVQRGRGSAGPGEVLLPEGVDLRVSANGGAAVGVDHVQAPGRLEVLPGAVRALQIVVRFGPSPPDRVVGLRYSVDVEPGEIEGERSCEIPYAAGRTPERLVKCRAPDGPVTVRWELDGAGSGSTVIDTRTAPLDGRHVVEVPVASWDAVDRAVWFRVTDPEGGARIVQAVAGTLHCPRVEIGSEIPLVTDPPVPLFAYSDLASPKRFAGPALLTRGALLELPLRPAGDMCVRWTRPPALAGWPLEVSRADGSPFVAPGVPGGTTSWFTDWIAFRLGPFPPGDVEFVFRLGGREVARRTAQVVAGETTEIELPEILPPER